MEDLKEKLELHRLWLENSTKGTKLNLRYADLSGADLSGADLSNTDLRVTNLREADLSGADLSNTDLRDADLRGANLSNTDLRGADLSNTDLRGAILRGANLRGANLRGADLRGANLSNTDLSNTDLSYCIGNNKEIKSLQIGTYLISYTKDMLNIGCRSYTLQEWKEFDDTQIEYMDIKALDWWKLNKEIVITLVEREVEK